MCSRAAWVRVQGLPSPDGRCGTAYIVRTYAAFLCKFSVPWSACHTNNRDTANPKKVPNIMGPSWGLERQSVVCRTLGFWASCRKGKDLPGSVLSWYIIQAWGNSLSGDHVYSEPTVTASLHTQHSSPFSELLAPNHPPEKELVVS
jgi:hypothetical protein